MKKVYRDYGNGLTQAYTLKSAKFGCKSDGNGKRIEDKTVVFAETVEFGSVAFTKDDLPEVYDQIINSGITIEKFAQPEEKKDEKAS